MRIDLTFAERILDSALKAGADLAEVFVVSSEALSVEVKSQEIDSFETSRDFGYSVRIIKNGRMGFSYSTALEDWEDVVKDAIETARYTEEDPYLDLAEPAELPSVEIFDNKIADIKEEDAIESAMEIERTALGTDSRIKKIRKAESGFARSEVVLINSKGVKSQYSSTSVTAQITLAAEAHGEAQMGWGYESSRFVEDIDFARVGQEAAQRALRLLGSKRAKTLKGYVLLESHVAAEFMSVLASSFSAENIQKGKSLLIGKKGEKILSENLNIIDNALLKGRIGSRPFDAEGMPSRKTPLVTEGVLQGYLYNIYTARKDGTNSTGNAVRGGIQSSPSVGITNLYLEAVSDSFVRSFDDLVSMIDSGMIVTEAMGVHTANPITGDFSVGVTGLWVEKGKVIHPVKEAAVSGNLLDLFSRVVAMSDKVRFFGKIGSPDILIEGVDISG